jgi:DNA-binding CsgD family transcriptional regulator
VAATLEDQVKKKGLIDIGANTNIFLNITENRLKDSVAYLKESKGYHVIYPQIKQLTTGYDTTGKYLVPPWISQQEAYKMIKEGKGAAVDGVYFENNGAKPAVTLQKPKSLSRDRIMVRYAEDGGTEKDGTIELRRGVNDLDLGNSKYAQVRVLVGKNKFMKGMAFYNDNMPEGVDVIYNSNKSRNDPLFGKVFKPLKTDDHDNVMWDNPFGANIKSPELDEEGNVVREVGQKHYIGKDGKKHLSSINVVNEAGDWQKWSKRLSAQFLSKQSPELAERQLGIAYEKKRREFDLINSLDNPEIKMKLLESFAEDCDSAAVHMKAAPLPHQQSHAILPIPSLKDYEVFAPNYRDGEIVSLVRHPHEGIYQIPTLVVNNHNKEAKAIIGKNAPDAIGINVHVANQLSGADFDGDSVMVLPNPNQSVIKSIRMQDHPQFKELSDFDTKIFTKSPDQPKTGKKKIITDENGKQTIIGDGFQEQKQMGMISNLIMDMTLAGAKPEELVRATKHSMVIIDSEKHNLDWRQSEKEYNIKQLKNKYQPGGGTGTIITRAKSQVRVNERKPVYKNMIDPKTGEIDYVETGRFKKDCNPKTGRYELTDKLVQVKSTKMDEARTPEEVQKLSSGTKMEQKYVDFANKMKAMANEARKTRLFLENTKFDKAAKEKYSSEVSSIMAKINEARKHKPLEQKVQAIADVKIKQLLEQNDDMDKEDIRKHRARIVKEARSRMGTSKNKRITLTDREWEAVKKGALTHSKINDLFSLMDVEVVKQYATPKNYVPKLSKSEIAYAKSLIKGGNYTNQEIADMLGVSASTLARAIERKE